MIGPGRTLVFLAAALVAAPGFAQSAEPAAPSVESPEKTGALALLAEGLALTQEGDFALALDKFREAYAIYPSAKLLINIGTSLRALGRQAEAAASYERYLHDPDAAPERVRELTALIGEIDKLVAWADVRVSEAGSKLRVDGTVIACSGGEAHVRLDPGSHTFVAEKGELAPAIVTLVLGPGERRAIPLRLAPKKKVMIEVRDGSVQRITGLALGGAGLAGIVAGAVLGGLAVASSSAAAGHCRADEPTICDGDGQRLGRRASQEATAATVALALGGAGLVAGAVVYFTAPHGDRRIDASLGLTGATLRFRW